ncbi:MAG: hypothetical protein OXU73_00400 [Candidatus Campbellbacteria bacterium]|nr:hypothetical protein [Candidatus Campbellbacteria bacterium]
MRYLLFSFALVFAVLLFSAEQVAVAQIPVVDTLRNTRTPFQQAGPSKCLASSLVPLSVIGSHPKPFEDFAVSARVGGNIDALDVVWKVNNREVEIDDKSEITIKAGDFGQAIDVVFEARSGGCLRYSGKTSVLPANIEIVWEALTSTTPLYYGRPLPPKNSSVKATLIIRAVNREGNNMSASDFDIKWIVNNREVTRARGGDSFTFRLLNNTSEQDIRAIISSDKIGLFVTKSIVFPSFFSIDPKVLLYKQDPIEGTLTNRILSDVDVEEDLNIIAIPYFFDETKQISFSWTLDGDSIGNVDNLSKITLRPSSSNNEKSVAKLKVDAVSVGSIEGASSTSDINVRY